MAISGSPDWSSSVASIIHSCNSRRKLPNNHNIIITTAFTPASKVLSLLLPLPYCSNFSSPFQVNSSAASCPSPILEDLGADFHVVRLDLIKHHHQDSQRYNEQRPPEEERAEAGDLNKFLSRLLKDPRTEDLAYEYYKKAQGLQDFRPEKSMFRLLIRYMVRSKKWGSILSLSNDFEKYKVLPDGYTCTRLVSSCIRARKFKVVEFLLEVFQSDSEVAVLAFYSAMRAYNKLHMYSTTVLLSQKMKSARIPMDTRCYSEAMKAYKKIGDVDSVVALFHEFESRKLESRPAVLGQIYRILCESLGKSGRAFQALEYFREMIKRGMLEDSQIYSCLICSFAIIREVNVAEGLFKEAGEKKLLRDPEVFLKLVLMYVEEGLLEKTLEVVKVMRLVDLRVSDCIFCAIVNGFSKKRGFWTSVQVYEKLISQGCEPGQVTYASMINAYCRIGLHSKAEMLFMEMERKGFDKCVVAYSSIIAMYGKTERVRDAMRLVAKMKAKGCEPNVWIYNTLLDIHGKSKNLRQVEKLWKEMKRRKVAPDKVTYTTIISAYYKAKEYKMCLELYDEYRMNGGVIDKAMAGIMVGVFSRTNRIDELVKLLQDMKLEGTPLDGRLYLSASNALRDAGLQLQAKWLQENFQAT